MTKPTKGSLISIGGHEDRQGKRIILTEVSRRAMVGSGRLVIVTAATHHPQQLADEYTAVFGQLGVPRVDVLDVRTRADAYAAANIRQLHDAAVIFFTGGDQVRITSQMGGSPVCRAMMDCYATGSTIAGTSAGAAAMAQVMIFSRIEGDMGSLAAMSMAPGLGLIEGVIIDSHFAERGRMARLLGAVAQNPHHLGIGIDEDTAIVVENGDHFTVLGSGAVYVVDGSTVTYSSLSERNAEGVLNIHDVTLHVLGAGDCFDLKTRRPVAHVEEQAD